MKIRILKFLDFHALPLIDSMPNFDMTAINALLVSTDDRKEETFYPSNKWVQKFLNLMKKSSCTVDEFYMRIWFTTKKGRKEELENLYQEFLEARKKRWLWLKRFFRKETFYFILALLLIICFLFLFLPQFC